MKAASSRSPRRFLQRGESLPWATEAKQKESNGDLARGTNIPPTCTIPVKTRN